MTYRHEIELHPIIKKHLLKLKLQIYEEVCFYNRKIDVIGSSKNYNKIVSVEAKLFDWLKAFRQALLYKACSHEVYVAMPECRFKIIDKNKFKKHGVGFLGISSQKNCTVLIKAVKNNCIKPHHKLHIHNSLAYVASEVL